MKRFTRGLIFAIISAFMMISSPINVYSATAEDEIYTTLRSIDLGTFNEYRYRMTEQFFALREHFEVENEMDKSILSNIRFLAETSYNYLQDNLENKNLLNNLLIDIQRGQKTPKDNTIYIDVVKSLSSYIEDVKIDTITGTITASPQTGNAPLSSTLRAQVQDPSGTQILTGNYTWWIDNAGQKVVIGRGPTINYTFHTQGNFTIFLDVTSSHKNSAGNIDVLPLRERIEINVQEKIASLIVNVNGSRVNDGEELKFTPSDADYGLIFDATSSTPTDGTKFERTQWNFGNGVVKSYAGGPKIERIRYGRQGDFPVLLRMTTNEGKIIESTFTVYVRDPIAKIEVNRQDGYVGDNFTFSAKSSGIYRDLTYNWQIIDIENDRIIHQKNDKVLTYSFQNKGKYNVQLRTRRASGEIDQDTRIVYVTSQAPIAEFNTKIPFSHKPNRVFFDASRSYDPDVSDDGKLKYTWIINGNRVNLEDAKANGSTGYYTFDSVGTQSIALEVTDPDGIMTTKQDTVEIDSILSVEMFAFPRVIQRENFIKFTANSPEAEVFEWDFGDGKTQGGSLDKVTHTYEKSGTFEVKLKVTDKDNNTNTFTRTVYVSESEKPLAIIDVSLGGLELPVYDDEACDGVGAYIVDRVQNVSLNAGESINIDGEQNGLEYSWKIGNGKFSTSKTVTHRFDELGCFPVKLTVQSQDNNTTNVREVMMQVVNVVPQMTALGVNVTNPTEDPLIVDVRALGARDPDGVIQSYLWYYYTDIDTQPQDFRSTAGDSTTFVLPKITGNYYFVAILKDNNEAKVTSEEATGSRYFTTITGDNINTPIVELTVNDNSVNIGDEVVFTAKAQNILGKDVSKDAQFSWDFDGDGFYDTQTSEPTTTYTYKKSGEFYAKVKVKHRGISSTRNITMNVSNKLVADFGYFSIGNKYIFFDSSLGSIDSRVWDLGDGNKKSGTNFEYEYTDKKSSHEVTLTISEGTKTKEITKTVTKNIRNILESRGKDLVVFTYPTASGGVIELDAPSEKVFAYMGESTENAANYVIDYDLENDTDLNGGMDDDADNKGTASYVSGDVMEIPLSTYKTQKIRFYITDENGDIIDSEDITIQKNYIEEENINPDLIIFENVTESEKQKIERLKEILESLPQQQRLRGLSYIQKLQENWNDETEKTRTILDFENYIFEQNLENEEEFIQLLESLLVEGQEDQSAKQITYQALINLVPADIQCETDAENCYEDILSKLADINASDDTEYNKALGSEILTVIGATELMTNQQKLDFKAILTSFVYGGEVDNIPEEEKQEVIDQTPQASENSGSLGSIFSFIGKILLWIIVIFAIIVGGLFIVYLIIGKKQNKTFTEFITRTTSFEEDREDTAVEEIKDIFAEDKKEKSDMFSQKIDPLSDAASTSQEKKDSEVKKEAQGVDEVPDWLKGNFAPEAPSDGKAENKKVPQKPINKSDEQEKTDLKTEKVPRVKEEKKQGSDTKQTPKTEAPVVQKEEAFDLEKDTKLQEESNVPDWLKGSFDTSSTSKDTEKKQGDKHEKIAENKGAKQENTQKNQEEKQENKLKESQEKATPKTISKAATLESKEEDVNVPDWLKGSFDTNDSQQEEKMGEKQKQEDAEKSQTEKKTKSSGSKKNSSKKQGKGEDAKEDSQKTTEAKQENKEELWNDGMKIPDWLKSDDEK